MATKQELLAVAMHFALLSKRLDEESRNAMHPAIVLRAAHEAGAASRLAFAEAEKIPTAERAVASDAPGSPTQT